VAKRLRTPYLPGQRSPTWLKLKNWAHVEVVVVGWLEDRDEGIRGWLRGLVVARARGADLEFAGVVELGLCGQLMDSVEQAVPMLAAEDVQATGAPPRVRWLVPKLVAEVQHLAGAGGELRHAVLRGLRVR
jgi:bifunctional non-homologous end joining protein LigD